jgi:hypothetical protein
MLEENRESRASRAGWRSFMKALLGVVAILGAGRRERNP